MTMDVTQREQASLDPVGNVLNGCYLSALF
jgi:hypothetical protein